jgi:hypothetical protein
MGVTALPVPRILAARARSAGPAIRHCAEFAAPEPHWKPQEKRITPAPDSRLLG